MLTMDQIHQIRELYYGQGITNLSEIAKITGRNRKTVTKYIDKEDFSSPPPEPANVKQNLTLLGKHFLPCTVIRIQHCMVRSF